ncbi:MAG: NADPH-dependent FMN reductase [Gammaproteobacteria bacterium HGW-Gammaproteobacteria-11]|nr:MAG: NADPH-dependent FMN reductase [Gammaproteobacteria bacterium HGW-Gammaproteobacteria-11]
MLVVSIAGSPNLKSRSGILLDYARGKLQKQGVEVAQFHIRHFNAEDLLYARFDSPQVVELAEQVNRADGLLIATPVYKASFSGALKVLLDLLPERALAHKVVLPIATGGSHAHMLAVDYALKPVLGALKAQEMLQGVFAEDSQIQYGEPAVLEANLKARLDEAVEHFVSALARRPAPIDPKTLNDRLINARWSI